MSMPDLPHECKVSYNDMRLQIGLLERDIADHSKVIDKLSEGIEKIEEMNTNLVRLLAVHDQKHETHDKIEDAIDGDIKELHSRITTANRDIQDRMDIIKRELYDYMEKLLVSKIQPIRVESPSTIRLMKQIEKWKYMLLGAAIVIGYLLDHIQWSVLLQLFGK